MEPGTTTIEILTNKLYSIDMIWFNTCVCRDDPYNVCDTVMGPMLRPFLGIYNGVTNAIKFRMYER